MTGTGVPSRRAHTRDRGFVLIEVLAAIAILGLLVASLSGAVQSACDSAIKLRDEASTISASSKASSHGEAWEWGPSVERTVWGPGPELHVTLSQDRSGEGTVGMWADGWHLGEWPVAVNDALSVGPSVWDGISDRELVVRVRVGEGPWGPPYRTIVPDQYGNVAVSPAALVEEPTVGATSYDSVSVSHVRYLGSVSLQCTGCEPPVTEIIEGTVAVLAASTAGLRDLMWEGRAQLWLASERRRIDVYW